MEKNNKIIGKPKAFLNFEYKELCFFLLHYSNPYLALSEKGISKGIFFLTKISKNDNLKNSNKKWKQKSKFLSATMLGKGYNNVIKKQRSLTIKLTEK